MRSSLMALALAVSSCGGSASETPFPPEPLDVNLEAEDLAPREDPYKAARPGSTASASAAPSSPTPPAKPSATQPR